MSVNVTKEQLISGFITATKVKLNNCKFHLLDEYASIFHDYYERQQINAIAKNSSLCSWPSYHVISYPFKLYTDRLVHFIIGTLYVEYRRKLDRDSALPLSQNWVKLFHVMGGFYETNGLLYDDRKIIEFSSLNDIRYFFQCLYTEKQLKADSSLLMRVLYCLTDIGEGRYNKKKSAMRKIMDIAIDKDIIQQNAAKKYSQQNISRKVTKVKKYRVVEDIELNENKEIESENYEQMPSELQMNDDNDSNSDHINDDIQMNSAEADIPKLMDLFFAYNEENNILETEREIDNKQNNEKWRCKRCTYVNLNGLGICCEICQCPRK